MSSTSEVAPVAKASRRRYLVLIPLLPALAALTMVATLPAQGMGAGSVSQTSAPGIVASSPAAAAATAAEPLPAVSAAPSPSAAADNQFSGPAVSIEPPPPPKVTTSTSPKSKSGKTTTTSGGTVVDVCDAAAFKTKSVSSAPYSSAEQSNLTLLNGARADAGLSSLAWSGGLSNSARAWAVFLAANDCYPYHSTVWTNGENLYYISGGSLAELAQRAHNGFMNSTGHRENILRSWFTKVGIGVAKSPTGAWYLVQNFSA